MFKRLILIFFLIGLSIIATASSLDSLRTKLGKAKNDSSKIELLYKYSNRKNYSLKTKDSLLAVILGYAKTKDCFVKYFCYYRVGVHYFLKESPRNAIENLLIALRIADSCGDKKGIMRIRNKLAFGFIFNFLYYTNIIKAFNQFHKEWDTAVFCYVKNYFHPKIFCF